LKDLQSDVSYHKFYGPPCILFIMSTVIMVHLPSCIIGPLLTVYSIHPPPTMKCAVRGTPMQFAMPMTIYRSKSKPEVEFQYCGRPFSETGSIVITLPLTEIISCLDPPPAITCAVGSAYVMWLQHHQHLSALRHRQPGVRCQGVTSIPRSPSSQTCLRRTQ